MIYSTNRTASLGEETIDVNESYFGAGAFNFMQENAQDELALFEAAIKSDIDEVIIGESAGELEALNEGFVDSAINKIKEMMRKFIEWLKSVTRSAIAKLAQLLVRDNAKFIKMAEKQIKTMRNMSKFKYTGKGLVIAEAKKDINPKTAPIENFYDQAKKDNITDSELDAISANIKKAVEEFKDKTPREDFEKECVKEVTEEGIDFVMDHIAVLKDMDKKKLSKLRKDMKEMEAKAKKLAKEAESKSRKFEEKDNAESKLRKKQLAVMAEAAAASRDCWQTHVSDTLYVIKQQAKIARAVVAKAMGASPKNEGFEYTEELVQAMIEAADFEYDEALEEMSEAKECDVDYEEDIEDEE